MELKFQNVSKEFELLLALDGLSFSAQNRDIVGILGPNGAGKTTLIKLAAHLSKPATGEISVDGIPIGKVDRAKFGLISPNSFLYSDLTVAENLSLYSRLYGKNEYWRECADYFNLEENLNKLVRNLSHGQKQRAALARVMITDPEILLLDEPFLGLDDQATKELINLILKLRDQERLILIATHNFEIASKIINKLMILDHGKLIHYDQFDNTMGPLHNYYNGLLERSAG
jgi:ABC-type multidrug transport system ATPase subunit